jgi:ABC-type multidrug transport system fused ATPase/permease subunit
MSYIYKTNIANKVVNKIRTWRNRINVVKISRFNIFIILLLTFIGTITELMGLSLFLPIFQFLRLDGDINALIDESSLWNYVVSGFQYFGLEVSIGPLLILSFLMFTVKQVVGYAKTLYEQSINLKTIRTMRDSLFDKYLHADIMSQEKNTVGSFINTLVVEINRFARGVMMPISLLGHIFILFWYTLVLFLLSWEMTTISIIISIITAKIVSYWIRQSKIVGRGITRCNTELANFLTPRINSLRVIKLSGTINSEIRKFKVLTKKQRDYFYEASVLMAKNKSIIEPVVVGLSLLFIYLSHTVFGMQVEMIGLYLIIILRLLPLLKTTIGLYQGIESVEGSVESVISKYNELSKHQEIDDGTKELLDILDGIEINNVGFKYPDADYNALSSIDISIKPGEMLSVVGPSGSGKSTLIDLIPRLIHPVSGEIKINSVVMEDFTLESLRNAISYLPQNPQIFSRTIKEHISYGSTNATLNDIYEAATLSGADHFIRNLKDGYDSIITDDALNISGGQRQRLDLARAIIKKSKILILDEPSSSLDAESEAKFRDALSRIRKKTNLIVIMITHRLLNAKTSDYIIVLNNGKIEDKGTHEKLISNSGWYSKAYKISII